MLLRYPVPFTLTLKQGWFGHFTGAATEEATRGMPGTGVINGYFSFPRIEFTKKMPVCYVCTPDDRLMITLHQHLNVQGYACGREFPHPPIFYQGEFSSVHKAQGIWIFRDWQVPLSDGRTCQMGGWSGVWSAERCNG